MVKPVLTGGKGKFFWELNSNVGINSPNGVEDVQLVQLGYINLAKSNLAFVTPDLKEIFGKVKPGDTYKPVESDPLTIAIRAHQKARGGPQDGHVSVVTSKTGNYTENGETHIFMAVTLIVAIAQQNASKWPRLDLIDKCPTKLAELVKAVFTI